MEKKIVIKKRISLIQFISFSIVISIIAIAILYMLFGGIKEKCESTMPAENWANKELMHQDLMNGVSAEQRLRYAKQGRYYIPKSVTEAYPQPHRDPKTNKVIIENSVLYRNDVRDYSVSDAMKWVDQGKYNLTTEEMKIEHARIQLYWLQLYSIHRRMTPEEENSKAEYERIIAETNIDWTQTEAAKAWSRAHSVDMSYRRKS